MSLSEAVKNQGFDDYAAGSYRENITFLLKGKTLYTANWDYRTQLFVNIKKHKVFKELNHDAISDYIWKKRNQDEDSRKK